MRYPYKFQQNTKDSVSSEMKRGFRIKSGLALARDNRMGGYITRNAMKAAKSVLSRAHIGSKLAVGLF
tara:strand:+ start:122 stop:325 length:204 start_codon:yes stop_codon:yes gene_type:complete